MKGPPSKTTKRAGRREPELKSPGPGTRKRAAASLQKIPNFETWLRQQPRTEKEIELFHFVVEGFAKITGEPIPEHIYGGKAPQRKPPPTT